jgi:hypothetical protein
MSKTPYRIIFCPPDDGYPNSGWEFDETEYETAEAAFDASMKDHQYDAVRIVKLCYPKED